MSKEREQLPEWARRERAADLAWIQKNVEIFWSTARIAFEAIGRGVIVVDTTVQPLPGAGHPFAYLPQQDVTNTDDDTKRMMERYYPVTEFVVLLLKSNDRSSTYRVQARERRTVRSNGKGMG